MFWPPFPNASFLIGTAKSSTQPQSEEFTSDLKQSGWLHSKLQAMLKPEAALGEVAIPYSQLLSALTKYCDKSVQ